MQVYCCQSNIESDNLEVNHIDGNKSNNDLSNLEWVSHQENMNHAYENGLNQNYCENNNCTYLSNDTVVEIIRRLKTRDFISYTELASEYNCSEVLIVRIATGRAWRRLSEKEGLEYFKINKRFSDDDVHNICNMFVKYKDMNFDEIYNKIIEELGFENSKNLKHKIRNIYYKKPHYFTRISDQYNY